ncbi:hypothetical protein HPP92_019652 [Vanilla planifolia]|uniref:Uncharacterized protein n=1 Tax=Vanilla planifolia TaxID=51239 RepID=A0A835UL54_VANPL|nr:hypothetical protein HPP92_019652 [Vanilla planifolia]
MLDGVSGAVDDAGARVPTQPGEGKASGPHQRAIRWRWPVTWKRWLCFGCWQGCSPCFYDAPISLVLGGPPDNS